MVHKFYAAADTTYWGCYDGPDPAAYVPADAVEVPAPPAEPYCLWDGSAWVPDSAAEDSAKDGVAALALNSPVNKVLRDLYWDIELRLGAAGQDSTLTDVAAAATKAAYTAVLKDRVKALL